MRSKRTLDRQENVAAPDPTLVRKRLHTQGAAGYESLSRSRNIARLLRDQDDVHLLGDQDGGVLELDKFRTNSAMTRNNDYKNLGYYLDLKTVQRALESAVIKRRPQKANINSVFTSTINKERKKKAINSKRQMMKPAIDNGKNYGPLIKMLINKVNGKRNQDWQNSLGKRRYNTGEPYESTDQTPFVGLGVDETPFVGLGPLGVEEELNDDNLMYFVNNILPASDEVSHPLRTWLGGNAAEVALNLYRDVKGTEPLRPGSRVNFIGK